MSVDAIPFADLQRRRREVAARAHSGQPVRVSDEDLLIVDAHRDRQQREAAKVAGVLFASIARTDRGLAVMLEAVPDGYPWAQALPPEDRRAFFVGLLDMIHNGADIEAQTQYVTEWRHSAQVYADPDLAAALTASLDGQDYGAVEVPE